MAGRTVRSASFLRDPRTPAGFEDGCRSGCVLGVGMRQISKIQRSESIQIEARARAILFRWFQEAFEPLGSSYARLPASRMVAAAAACRGGGGFL